MYLLKYFFHIIHLQFIIFIVGNSQQNFLRIVDR